MEPRWKLITPTPEGACTPLASRSSLRAVSLQRLFDHDAHDGGRHTQLLRKPVTERCHNEHLRLVQQSPVLPTATSCRLCAIIFFAQATYRVSADLPARIWAELSGHSLTSALGSTGTVYAAARVAQAFTSASTLVHSPVLVTFDDFLELSSVNVVLTLSLLSSFLAASSSIHCQQKLFANGPPAWAH